MAKLIFSFYLICLVLATGLTPAFGTQVNYSSQIKFNDHSVQGAHENLRVVLLKNSGWTKELFLEQLKSAQKVYSGCLVFWDNIEFIEVEISGDKLTLNKHAETLNSNWSLESYVKELGLFDSNLITIYLVKDFSDDSPTAFSRANFEYDRGKTDPVLFNSVWLPFDVIAQAPQKNYSILAHELTHIYLLEGSHFGHQPPDILSIFRQRNNFIGPYCEGIQKSIAVRTSLLPKLNGKVPLAQFPDIQEKANRIWQYLSHLIGKEVLPLPPEINFYEFSKADQSLDFSKWQKSWLHDNLDIWNDWTKLTNKGQDIKIDQRWVNANIDRVFPFPETFLAFHYDGTNRIQMNPKRTMMSSVQGDASGKATDLLGAGYYIMAHEMLHYALEQKGIVPTKLHHCLYVSDGRGSNSSLMDQVSDYLIAQKITSPMIKITNLRTEKSFNPCAGLSEQERGQVQEFLKGF